MKNHPYTSETFIKKWLMHFDKHQNSVDFDAVKGPVFFKKGFIPIFANSGSNFTLQGYYQIVPSLVESLKKKVIVIFDVPNYFNTQEKIQSNCIKRLVVREYVGYLIDLNGFDTSNTYLNERFSAKSRSKFRSYSKKLENVFAITYTMFFGTISKKQFDHVMDYFYEISVKSFALKNISNRKLLPENFAFLKEVTYELILEKKACLFVIYDQDKPIGISLNFTSDTILFGDSTVYDFDYSKFNIGTIMLIKQIDWCIDTGFKIYDFSKAHFPYKEKWCNVKYYFQHHILYDSKHLSSSLIGHFYAHSLRLKQYLREHPLRAKLNENVLKKKRREYANYIILKDTNPNHTMIEVPIQSELIKAVNDFLFSSSDNISNVKIFEVLNTKDTYCIQGEKVKRIISFVKK